MGEIGNIVTGSTPSKTHSEYYGNEYPFFKPTDLEQGINTIIAEDNLSKIGFLQARQLPKNSILVTCIGATIGKTGLIKTEGTCNQQINAIIPNNSILPIFLFFSCLSDFMQESIISNSSSTTLPILNKSKFASLLLPLPPIEEQSRIIDTLKIIFAQIMTVEQNKSDLKLLIKHAKSKILDLAIHGKLIPQDPADEPAEELLKRIATSDNRPYEKVDEEVDYEIPKSWRFCKIKDVCSVIMGQSPEGEAVSDDKNGMEFHQGKICFGEKYLEESSSFTKHITKIAPKDSVLLCVRAPVGIVNITEREICIGRGLCAVIPKYEINSDFWFYWLQSLQSDFEQKATGTT
ncbi:MAG: restriction endonuclease subunit S, partial [Treponema porcinum]|uniref:restriction endonuclease subunit S n=1 Tax=Treponema porcinum TaxID=261392 RepID=UPI003C6F8537|nr:restriction endonuclease subunit S [Treponema porcinum]